MKAIILSAGQGSRLLPLTQDRPKCLLPIGPRHLLEWQVREKVRQAEGKLKGVYPGQPGRHTSRPSAELLLAAFTGISLTLVEVAGKVTVHITPLNPLQERLLTLWELPSDLFHRLTLHSAEPPRLLGER